MDSLLTYEDISDIVRNAQLSPSEAEELLSCCNNIGNITSETIHKYALFFLQWKGESYRPTIRKMSIPSGTFYSIEPDCGSNTYIIDTGSSPVVIDTGFPSYHDELKQTLCSVVDNFLDRNPALILTHMDMDHSGLLSCFKRIYMSQETYNDFVKRKNGSPNFRESVPARRKYYRITSVLSRDSIASVDSMIPISSVIPDTSKPLSFIGNLSLENLTFEVYQTSGGHVEGSIILFERKNRLVFAGDTYVNPKMNENQKDFISTSMDMLGSLNADSVKSKAERNEMFKMMGAESWILCGGHGPFIEYPF